MRRLRRIRPFTLIINVIFIIGDENYLIIRDENFGRAKNGAEEMITIFDVFSLVLLIASMALFVRRYMQQDPPVYPYLIIACTCLVGNWLGEAGGGVYALGLLTAGAFSFLGCLLYPSWRSMGGPQSGAQSSAQNS